MDWVNLMKILKANSQFINSVTFLPFSSFHTVFSYFWEPVFPIDVKRMYSSVSIFCTSWKFNLQDFFLPFIRSKHLVNVIPTPITTLLRTQWTSVLPKLTSSLPQSYRIRSPSRGPSTYHFGRRRLTDPYVSVKRPRRVCPGRTVADAMYQETR